MFLGRWEIDDLLTFTVNTSSATTGAATDGDSVPTYRVYEDETGTAILTGSMALLDDANTVGLYSEQITLSAANGFEVGKCYNIRIAATVGGVAGATTRNFQVESALALASALATVQADTDDIQSRIPAALTANGNMKSSLVEILTTALTETAGLLAGGFKKFFNIASPVSTMDVIARTTLTDTLTTYTGNTVQTGDSFARIGATGSSLTSLATAAQATAIQADTDDIQTRLPAALTANGNMKADTLRVSGTVQTAGDLAALLNTIDDFVDTEVAAIKAKTDNLPSSPAAVGSAMTLDLTQAVPTTNTGQTVGDALNAARAQGFGKWSLSGTTLTLFAADGSTTVRTFTLDSATVPTSRT